MVLKVVPVIFQQFRVNFKTKYTNSHKNSHIHTDLLLSSLNHSIRTSVFPSRLKQANITPTFKKGDTNLKENYRLVRILRYSCLF